MTQVDSSKNDLQKIEPNSLILANTPDITLLDEYSFYIDTSETKYIHLIDKVDHLLKKGDLLNANKVVARIPLYSVPTRELSHYYKSTALCAYLNQETDNALSIIRQYELTDSLGLVHDTAAQLLKCLILLSKDDYTNLAKSFSQLEVNFKIPEAHTIEIDSMIAVGKNLKLKSAKKAAFLSAIIPGSGQMYTGHVEEGIINFGLNLATLSFTVFCIYKGYYATGILVGYTLFQRFYTGGLRRADKLSTDYNNSLTIPLKQNLKERIIRLNLQSK
jgi:TM2 domain-containing membrane protein YozV